MISVVLFTSFNLIIRNGPDSPPSSTALEKPVPIDFFNAGKSFMTNKNYLFLTMSYGLAQGTFAAISTLKSSIFDPYGISPDNIALLGSILLIAGMIAAPIVGIYIGRSGKYIVTIRCLAVLLTLSLLYALYTLHTFTRIGSLFFAISICGAAATAYIPATLSLANELTFPMQPAATIGLMNICGSICASFLGLLGTWMTTLSPK